MTFTEKFYRSIDTKENEILVEYQSYQGKHDKIGLPI